MGEQKEQVTEQPEPIKVAPAQKRKGGGPPPRFLLVGEVAALLSIDEQGVWRLLRLGKLPGVKLGGRWLIPASAIDALEAEAHRAAG